MSVLRSAFLWTSVFLAACVSPVDQLANRSDTAREPLPSVGGNELIQRSEWQIGDRWVYRWKHGLAEGRVTRVIEDVTPGGFTMLYVETGRRRFFTPDLEVIADVLDGKVVSQNSPPWPFVKFPLAPHGTWLQGAGPSGAGYT